MEVYRKYLKYLMTRLGATPTVEAVKNVIKVGHLTTYGFAKYREGCRDFGLANGSIYLILLT